jgi:hypothetical protein
MCPLGTSAFGTKPNSLVADRRRGPNLEVMKNPSELCSGTHFANDPPGPGLNEPNQSAP